MVPTKDLSSPSENRSGVAQPCPITQNDKRVPTLACQKFSRPIFPTEGFRGGGGCFALFATEGLGERRVSAGVSLSMLLRIPHVSECANTLLVLCTSVAQLVKAEMDALPAGQPQSANRKKRMFF